MALSPNLNLPLLSPGEDSLKDYEEWVHNINGSGSESGFSIIDTAVGEVKDSLGKKADLVDDIIEPTQLPPNLLRWDNVRPVDAPGITPESIGAEAQLKTAVSKASPVVDDNLVITDSEDNNKTKRIVWSDIISAIKTALNSVYVVATRTINNKPLSQDIALAATDVGAIPASEKGQPNGVAALDENGMLSEDCVPGGKADAAVIAHNTSDDPHPNKHYVSTGDSELAPPVPVNADQLEGASKEDILATALAAATTSGLHLFGPVTVTVPLSSWTGTGPWTQTVSVEGLTTADDHISITPFIPTDRANVNAIGKAYNCIAPMDGEAVAVDGGIKLTCYKAKPALGFQITVKGIR